MREPFPGVVHRARALQDHAISTGADRRHGFHRAPVATLQRDRAASLQNAAIHWVSDLSEGSIALT